MENKKAGYLVITLFGLLVLIFVGSSAWQTLKFRSVAFQADGTIIGEKVIVGGKKTSYRYPVVYTSPDASRDTVKIHVKSPFYKDGEKVQIYIDPSNPQYAATDVSISGNFLGIIIGLLMLVWGFPKYLQEVKNEKARTRPKL